MCLKPDNWTVIQLSKFDAINVFNVLWFPVEDNKEMHSELDLTVRLLDVNDNVPKLIEDKAFICMMKPKPVIIKAKDGDSAPFSQPFTFVLGSGKSQNWALVKIDGTFTDKL